MKFLGELVMFLLLLLFVFAMLYSGIGDNIY